MNIQVYSISLMTSFEKRKNSTVVAREIGVHQSKSSRFLKNLNITEDDFVPLVKEMFGTKKLDLIIDDSSINKRFSEQTEGISSIIDQSTKTFTNGYKIVVAGLTDGSYFLPIAFEQWIAEFIMQNNYYTIIQRAEMLILRIEKLGVSIRHHIFDGLYFSKKFISFLDDNGKKFLIKAKTTTSVIYKGQQIQLQHCKALRLNSNQNAKVILAEWNNKMYYFIAIRRSGKHGEKIIYLIANFKAKANTYRKIYNSRWNVEKFFRTGKQSLGLKDSLSTQANIYLNHIKCVFFSYCLLQILMKKFKLFSVEEAIRKAQAFKIKYGFKQTSDQISLLSGYA